MSVAELLAKRLARGHAWIMEALEPLDDAALQEKLGPRAPSIAFHAWHVARWADRVQARLGMIEALRGVQGERGTVSL